MKYRADAKNNEEARARSARKVASYAAPTGALAGGVIGAGLGGLAGGLATGGAGILPGMATGAGLGSMVGGGAGQLVGMGATHYADEIERKREEEKLKRIQNQERAMQLLAPYLSR